MDLHKSHNHSHLLEEELGNKRDTETLKKAVIVVLKKEKIRHECQPYLPDAGVADPDHVEKRRHDLRQELDALEAQGLEDEGDGLHHHGVVVGERRVPEDAHQRDDGHGRVKLIQRQVAHVDEHLAGAVVGCRENQNRDTGVGRVGSKGQHVVDVSD